LIVTLPGPASAGDPGPGVFARRVLELVGSIPRGKVMTYGDIAEFLEEGGPRRVGAVLSRHGSAIPWWRVVNATGMLPPDLRGEAARHYEMERTPYDKSRERVNLSTARWDGR
jgi:alkylated DNA nucleotide flippase Atl1